MDKDLNIKILQNINEYLPPDENIVNTLMELLSLGKEAVYRRFRNEVPFTLEETIRISQKFEISLDQMFSSTDNLNHAKWASFDINKFYTSQNYVERYSEKIDMFLSMIREMQKNGKGILRSANNIIPYTFYLSFEKLSKFRYYKWSYLATGVNPNFHFSEMVVPPRLLQLEKILVKEARLIPRTLLILDKNIFSSVLNDIRYFFDRGFLSEKEVVELKDELYGLLSFIENLTATGTYGDDTEVIIFLSEIDLDASYVHIEYGDKDFCANWTYFIDVFLFDNPKMSQKQKEWIELLKRYSTLITQTGEVQRFAFFNKQRQLIDTLI